MTIRDNNQDNSDQQYLDNCMNSFDFLYNRDDLAFIKNLDYRYISATTEYSKLLLLTDKTVSIVGKYDHEIIQAKDDERLNLLLQKIRYYDDLTINTKNTTIHMVIAIGTPNNPITKMPLFCRLKPLINPATENVVGILGRFEHMHLLNMPLFILKNSQKYKKYNFSTEEISLNETQHVLVFLLCNFLSANEIKIIFDALGMAKSLSNINAMIQGLKDKFGVATKDALVEKALRMNYHVAVPERLFPEIFYDLDEFMLKII